LSAVRGERDLPQTLRAIMRSLNHGPKTVTEIMAEANVNHEVVAAHLDGLGKTGSISSVMLIRRGVARGAFLLTEKGRRALRVLETAIEQVQYAVEQTEGRVEV